MTFEERAREAGEQLGEWAPPDAGSEVAVGRAARRSRRRAGALGCVAAGLLVAGVVAFWPGGDGRRVVAVEPDVTTTTVGGCRSEVAVWMSPGADAADIAVLGTSLDDDPRVAGQRYLDDAASYDLFQRAFERDRPEMLGAVRPGDLPTSFRVALSGGADRAEFVRDMQSRPGVYAVDDDAAVAAMLPAPVQLPCPDGHPADELPTTATTPGQTAPTSAVAVTTTTALAPTTTADPGAEVTRVRVELRLRPVVGCGLDSTCLPVDKRADLGPIAISLFDTSTGRPVDAASATTWVVPPGRYAVAVRSDAAAPPPPVGCAAATYARSFELTVGDDGALRLDLVGEVVGTVGSSPAPDRTPTLVPVALEANAELLPSC